MASWQQQQAWYQERDRLDRAKARRNREAHKKKDGGGFLGMVMFIGLVVFAIYEIWFVS